ncbi:MAG: GMC oxidoreductase [Myxococcota bacterium]
MSEVYDVCIIGSGAGGGFAAASLAKSGAKVLLLEAGPRFTPSDYPAHDPQFELKTTPFVGATNAAAQRSWTPGPPESLSPDFPELRSDSPSAYAAPSPTHRHAFSYSHVHGLGGTTLHYQGEAHRFPPHAFRMREKHGVASDWPIDYGTLAPYYAQAEQALRVAGDPGNPFKAARDAFPSTAHPAGKMGRFVAQGASRLGWQSLPNTLAILKAAAPNREACHYCNGCIRGCAVGAKSSVDVAVIPAALATGNLVLKTQQRVLRLEHGSDGRIKSVIAVDLAAAEASDRASNGSVTGAREIRYEARSFILATGAIETPRLMLASAGGAHPRGVGNGNDLVGRGLMETLYVYRFGTAEESLESHVGVPIESRIWDFNGSAAAKESGVPNGFALGQMAGFFEGPVGTALEGAEGFGRAHREQLRARFGYGTTLIAIAEQLPRAENRVVLSDEMGPQGTPLARIDATLNDQDLKTVRAMHRRVVELEDAAGLTYKGQSTAYDTPSATHVGGTCPMGLASDHSVVDAEGFVWGAPNLAIADASVLVTQGAGDSPSLTIQALALRTADALRRRASGAEL